jgi:hypothetical protein
LQAESINRCWVRAGAEQSHGLIEKRAIVFCAKIWKNDEK